ncbi:MAG TPA: EVE domain-containing protein, partial [Candidatus Marinimicrobia bacterium]|nr:EVE domain-containing protein [Candidatus Neomarinimicrobiota bacterium]
TYWDGVTNNWALKFIREVSKGDKAFIYHTGNQRCVAGVANVISDLIPILKRGMKNWWSLI